MPTDLQWPPCGNFNGVKAFRRSPEPSDGRAYENLYSLDHMSWNEEGVLSLTGKFCPPGLQWYLPQVDTGLYCVSAMFQVEDAIAGHTVRGFVRCDRTSPAQA